MMQSGTVRGTPMGLANRSAPAIARPVARQIVAARASANDQKKLIEGLRDASVLATIALLQTAPAVAAEEEADALTSIVDSARAAQKTIQEGIDVVKQGVDAAMPYAQDAYTKAMPIVKSGLEVTTKAASEAAKVASPYVQSSVTEAGKLLQSSGVDTGAIKATAEVATKTSAEAVTVATPFLQKVINFVTTTDTLTLAEYGLGAAAVLLLTPIVFGSLGGLLRGYAGSASAAAALDELAVDGSSVLVDVRSLKDKEQFGCPDVPGSARSRVVELEFAEVERGVRAQLKNAGDIEARMTAMQVADLRRLSRGNKLFVLDKNGGKSDAVARYLAGFGFGRVYVVSGGFEGRNGWVQSKLSIRAYKKLRPMGPVGTILSTVRR